MELYFDLEKTKTTLADLNKTLFECHQSLMEVYMKEDQKEAEGEKLPTRTPLDLTSRSAIGASLAMFFPQIKQISLTIDLVQRSCEILCPALQTSQTPN